MLATTLRDHSLSRFVPFTVLNQIAESGEDKLIPRKDSFPATVLFADISGFTRLSEELGKRGSAGVEELTQTLNAYFGDLIDTVISHGGDIVKFAGDALLAVWQASGENLSHTVRAAARCGLLAQSLLRDRTTNSGEALSLRMGIGTGIIATASVGGTFNRWEFVVSGKPVSEATTAADAAQLGELVLGPLAAKQLGFAGKGQPVPGGQLCLKELSFEDAIPPREMLEPKPNAETKVLGYIPAAIRQRLDVGHGNWLGELRRLTVLFVNLPGLNHATPLPLAQKVMQSLQSGLYRYEGSVNKLSADDKGITFVAALGLPPLSHEDDELRGVLAGLEIQSRLKDIGQACSIGITSGRVFCGIIGNQARCEYTMIGDVVNLSARLMQKAQGGILCDHATALAANRQLDFEALPPMELKGKAEPVPVFRPSQHSRPTTTRRAFEPMIGREAEQQQLDRLQQCLVAKATGSVTVIDGEPGIGKSRLVAAIKDGANSKNISTYLGSALDRERSTPYFAWRGVFRELLHMEGLEESANSPADVEAHLQKILKERGKPGEWAPLLNPVLTVELPDNAFTSQFAQEARITRTNELLLRLLQVEAKLHPTQFILEDCHWMDSASWMLLRMVAEAAEDFLVFLITRPLNDNPPAEFLQIQEREGYSQISLKPLSENDVEALVCRNLAVSELPRQVAELIRTKAQGNPLFGEELGYALRDAGVIQILEGRCMLDSETDLAELGFPDTVQGVVTSRIDRLVPCEQLTLKVASVIGRSFSCQILQEMFPVEKDRSEQPAQLRALTQRDLIALEDLNEDLAYQFRHVITQEVAYDLIPPTQRQELHRAIAEWYEAEYGEDLAPYYALLAKHWSHTNQTDKALMYLEKSGENAAKQFANLEVIQFFTQAMKLNDTAGGLVEVERRAEWERQVADAYYNLGDMDSSLEHFRSTLQVLHNPFPQGRLDMAFSTALELGKQLILKWLPKRFRGHQPGEGTRRLRAAQCYERLAQIHYLNNSRLLTIHAVFKSLNLAESLGSSAVLARCYANAAVVAGLLFMHSRACHYAERAQQVAKEVNDPDCTSYVNLINSIYWVTVGEWDRAEILLTEAMTLADRIGARRRWAESAFTLVIGHWRRGDITRCRELARQGFEVGQKERVPEVQLWGLSWWTRCLLAQSNDHSQIQSAAEQLKQCLKHNDLTPADRILGQGMLAAGYWRLCEKEAALAEADQVLELISKTNQISHFVIPAYAALFEIYIGLWENEFDTAKKNSLNKKLKMVRKTLKEFGLMYPVGRVRHALLEGKYHQYNSNLPRAMKYWTKALKLAERYDTPLVAAQAHWEFARALPKEDPTQAHHEQQAREIFQRNHAEYFLLQMDRFANQ